jgi:hypothetical protein
MRLRHVAWALLLAGSGATVDHIWGRVIDVPLDIWWPQQEPTLGREVSIQTPKDFPYTIHLARPMSGTSVEIWPADKK